MTTLPYEITYSILESAGNSWSLKELFDLRLVNSLFANQAIRVAIWNGSISRVIKTCDNAFGALSDWIKRRYLHFTVQKHAQGRPSVFSTFIYRAYNLKLAERNNQPAIQRN